MCRGGNTYVESLEEEKKFWGKATFLYLRGLLSEFDLFVCAVGLWRVQPIAELCAYRLGDPGQKTFLPPILRTRQFGVSLEVVVEQFDSRAISIIHTASLLGHSCPSETPDHHGVDWTSEPPRFIGLPMLH